MKAKRPITTHARAAKLLRQMLKEAFPGTKFSVRPQSYAGGSSIRFSWENGPTTEQAKRFGDLLEGKYFDGMIDYAGYKYLTFDGKDFSSVSYVFEEREYSDEWILDAIAAVAFEYGIKQLMTVAEFRMGKLYQIPVGGCTGWDSRWNAQTMIREALSKRTEYEAPHESPTAARFGSRGDDGYGMGTVGNEANGWQGSGAYSAMEQARQRYQEQH